MDILFYFLLYNKYRINNEELIVRDIRPAANNGKSIM